MKKICLFILVILQVSYPSQILAQEILENDEKKLRSMVEKLLKDYHLVAGKGEISIFPYGTARHAFYRLPTSVDPIIRQKEKIIAVLNDMKAECGSVGAVFLLEVCAKLAISEEVKKSDEIVISPNSVSVATYTEKR